MQPRGMDFVVYGVSDLEKGVAFYRDTLGLAVENVWPQVPWAEFTLQPGTLALDASLRARPQPGYQGGATVAIAVGSVAGTVAELSAKGVQIVVDTFETPVCFIAVIADPDGNRLLLHQRKDGTAG